MFKKVVENFFCDKCSAFVSGSGFTNHCPKCLWSKHVDIDPGDRLSLCKALMEPVGLEGTEKNYVLIHKCTQCGFLRKNKVSEGDNFLNILEIVKKTNKK